MQIADRILSISLFSLVISFSGFSQVNQDNIYSRFGLGDIVNGASGTERAMGGAGIAVRTKGVINFLNPAALTAIDTMSFILDIGLQSKFTYAQTSQTYSSLNDINAGHLAMGFPISRWWKTSLSLMPYSTLGYSIRDTTTIKGSYNLVDNFYSGSGGTNAFTWGNGFKIFKNFSIGFNAVYLFGTMQNNQYNDFNINVQSNTNYSTTTFQSSTLIGGFYGNVGFQFSDTVAKKYLVTIGGTYGPKARVGARTDLYVKNELSVSSTSRVDTVYNQAGTKSSIDIPARLGLGLSVSSEKFTFAFDYYQQNWSSASIMGVNDSLVNLRSFRAGLEYIPKYNSISNYFQRVRYRLGYHYTNTYLSLGGHQINDYGVSLGFGFPFRNSPTILNLSFEVGRRGTTADNLVMETYGIIYLNIALGDVWFLKRVFE